MSGMIFSRPCSVHEKCFPSLLTYDFHNSIRPVIALYEEMGVSRNDLIAVLILPPTLIPRTSFNEEMVYIKKTEVSKGAKMYKYVVALIGMSRLRLYVKRVVIPLLKLRGTVLPQPSICLMVRSTPMRVINLWVTAGHTHSTWVTLTRVQQSDEGGVAEHDGTASIHEQALLLFALDRSHASTCGRNLKNTLYHHEHKNKHTNP
ncbi:uncharacterized protein LOC111298927 isoform X2 [Durio zibethinus]|uniref:Uncharacterized protein LOC111298927 isoform X2 n=1 Tax=Durio zibethinus TaxID=66656 RepID=A0A6P5ZAL3_DURZI|nr:uncharacterized protein LOC111298927 isoform X2 [Durio zibethinus]